MATTERFRIPARNCSPSLPPPLRSTTSQSLSPASGPTRQLSQPAVPRNYQRSRSEGFAVPNLHLRTNSTGSATSESAESVKFLNVEGIKVNLPGLKSAGNVFKKIGQIMTSGLLRFGGDVSNMAIEIKGDTMDLSKTAFMEIGKGSKKLCSECAKIRFGDCIPGGPQAIATTYEYLRPLERIIMQRDICLFCNALYQAMCMKENDPLDNKHIKDHIQDRLKRKSFQEWTEDANLRKSILQSESVWPFGHSRDTIDDGEELQQVIDPKAKSQTRISTNMPKSSYFVEQAPEAVLIGGVAGLKGAKMLGNLSERDRNIIELADAAIVGALLSSANRRKPLPCWVLIKLYSESSNKSGLLVVHVAARNREPRSALKEISRFHLRVASSPEHPARDQPLRYGKILSEYIDVRLSNLWLDVCKERHAGCRAHAKVYMNNFRVINLHRYCLEDYGGGSLVEYAALSYVWGIFDSPRLSHGTMKQYYMPGGLRQENVTLPRAIVGAIAVAKQVGLKYMWCDALCVLQDDKIDLDLQIGQMDKIYKNSTLTIVAADGDNANSELRGVLTKRDPDQFVAKEVRPNIQILMPRRGNVNLEPWQTRAWTLQEKMLSNRLLIFSGGHMMWHCRESVHYEDMTASDARAVPGTDRTVPLLSPGIREDDLPPAASFTHSALDGNVSVVRSPAYEKYAALIADYTHRKMKFSSDVLRALSGIMPTLNKTFAQNRREDHEIFRYGIPQTVIDVALLWQPAGSLTRRRHCGKPMCTEPFMPSWSWAGWEGDIAYEPCFSVRTDEAGALVQLIEPHGLERIRPVVQFYARGIKNLSEWVDDGCAGSTTRESTNSLPKRPAPPFIPPKKPALPPKKLFLNHSGPISPPSQDNTFNRPKSRPAPPKTSSQQADFVSIGLITALGTCKSMELWTNNHRPEWLQGEELPWTWEAASPNSMTRQLSARHVNVGKQFLVFQSQIVQFYLGSTFSLVVSEQTLEREDDDFTPPDAPARVLRKLRPLEHPQDPAWIPKSNVTYTKIIDARNREVGRVQIHDVATQGDGPFDFVALSEAQFFGDELSIDNAGFPLYNVMLVSKPQGTKRVRYRLGLGKIWKHAWRLARPMEEVVVLG